MYLKSFPNPFIPTDVHIKHLIINQGNLNLSLTYETLFVLVQYESKITSYISLLNSEAVSSGKVFFARLCENPALG